MGDGRWGGRARDDWSPEARKAAAESRSKNPHAEANNKAFAEAQKKRADNPRATNLSLAERERLDTMKKPERLGFKSNSRNPERMAHGNARKFIPSREQH